MRNLLDIKGIKTLSRKQQSCLNGGGETLAETCDSICAATVANTDPGSGLVRWACDCNGSVNDRR